MIIVVDASVALKWVIEEPDSSKDEAIRSRELLAPELILSECGNASWRACQRGQLTASAAIERMAALANAPVALLPVQSFVVRALGIAVALGHPVYDAVYLAVAEVYTTQVVTADTRLLRRLAGSAFAHLAVSLEDAAAN